MNDPPYMRGFLNTLAEKQEELKNPLRCDAKIFAHKAPKYFNNLDRQLALKGSVAFAPTIVYINNLVKI